jgi:hypothetical protein
MVGKLSIQDEDGNNICYYLNYDPDDSLAALRSHILSKKQVSFVFVLLGVPLKTKQEVKTSIKRCASTQSDGTVTITVRRTSPIKPKTPNVADQGIKTVELGDNETTSDIRNEGLLDKNIAKQTSTATTKKCLKIFTDTELSDAVGVLEKERLQFWNTMAVEIENSSQYKDWGIQEKHGIIDTSWTMKKSDLLKLTVKKCLADRPETSNSHDKERSLMKNLDKVDLAHFTVNSNYEKLCKGLDSGVSMSRLEEEFDNVYTELKKAQADLTKAIAAHYVKEKNDSEEVKDPTRSDVAPPLSKEEIQEIAEEVTTGYESLDSDYEETK